MNQGEKKRKKTEILLDIKNESEYGCHCMSKIFKEVQKKSKRCMKKSPRRAKRDNLHAKDKKDVG